MSKILFGNDVTVSFFTIFRNMEIDVLRNRTKNILFSKNSFQAISPFLVHIQSKITQIKFALKFKFLKDLHRTICFLKYLHMFKDNRKFEKNTKGLLNIINLEERQLFLYSQNIPNTCVQI